MDLPVKSITDLRLEISRLKGVELEGRLALGNRFNSPAALFSTVFSIFSGPPTADGVKRPGFFDQDIAGLISRFVLPFTLNKTLFRNSNFIIKALVGLVSQKVSHFITEDSVVSVWDKVKSLFHHKDKTETPAHRVVPA